MGVIEIALRTAADAHRNQCRKGTDIPYIAHPVAVGMILMKAGYSDTIVAAGILHDTVEDTALTLQDIERDFGPMIAEIVAGCSEPDKSLSWEDRKKHTIEFLKNASSNIRAVACADKLDNIRSIIKDYEQLGDEVWKRFNRGKNEQEWYYRNIVNSLSDGYSLSLVAELEKEVNMLFNNNNEQWIKNANEKSNVYHEDDFSATEDAALDKDDCLGKIHPNHKQSIEERKKTLEIRLLDSSDAENYWSLRLEALKKNPEAFLTSYEESIKRENPVEQVARNFTTEGNYTFGAFDSGKLIGAVTLLQEDRMKIRHRANIFAMFVASEKQGLGVGKALLTEAINKARNIEAIEKINLNVTASNVKAKKLYSKLGFKEFGFEEKALRVDGVDYADEYMVLHLK
jgi:ribosomal protein S18 acetylase RimI-like enzyme